MYVASYGMMFINSSQAEEKTIIYQTKEQICGLFNPYIQVIFLAFFPFPAVSFSGLP